MESVHGNPSIWIHHCMWLQLAIIIEQDIGLEHNGKFSGFETAEEFVQGLSPTAPPSSFWECEHAWKTNALSCFTSLYYSTWGIKSFTPWQAKHPKAKSLIVFSVASFADIKIEVADGQTVGNLFLEDSSLGVVFCANITGAPDLENFMNVTVFVAVEFGKLGETIWD